MASRMSATSRRTAKSRIKQTGTIGGTVRASPAGAGTLTQQVADALMEYADAKGVIVVTECEHMCMAMRGVNKPRREPSHRRSAA